jgi:hypothetical protein
MSTQITEARIQGFKQGVDILSQQKGTRLQGAVRVEMQSSKQDHYDQISATAAVQRTVRHGDTPIVHTPHSRRAVTMTDWEWADLVDRQDRLRILNDPTNAYSINAGHAMGRVKDTLILEAAGGLAKTGEGGGSTQAFDTNNSIAAGGTGLTVTKLVDAKHILDLNNTDPEPTFMVVTANQLNDLLNENEIQSADYNTVKALVNGEVNTFMGFNFIMVDAALVPQVGGDRACYFWRRSGMLLSIGEGESGSSARITERADKGYSTQVYYSASYGSVRMEEAKVGRVLCQE